MASTENALGTGPNTRVADLIRAKGRRLHTIDRGATVAQAAEVFLDKEISALLVLEGGRVVGIFTKNDVVRLLLAGSGPDHPVAEAMSTDLFAAEPAARLDEVFAEMLRRGVRHVPVMENDQPVGMITPIDILVHQNDSVTFQNDALMRYIHGSY